jgi:hypothetical protein
MRYREMTPEGDYTFCSGTTRFLVNTPAAVAQAVLTKLRLFTEEWFLDSREGVERRNILGYGTQGTRDHEVRQRILATPGVRRILSYSSQVSARAFTVAARIDTIYGPIDIQEVL